MVFGLIYMIFNVIYIVGFDGTDIFGQDFVYPILDWKNNLGWSLFFVGMSLMGFPLLFSVFYALAKFRDYLWRKGLNIEDEENSTSINTNGVYSISIKLQEQKQPE